MAVARRRHLSAGVAAQAVSALGVTVLALSPVAPPAPAVALPELAAAQAIELTAFDVITPWLAVFNNTVNNVVTLITDVISPPLPVAQQVLANQLLHLSELPDIGTIVDQVVGNIAAAATAPVGADLFSMDLPHALGFVALDTALNRVPALAGAAGIVGPLLNFTASFLSGALIGLVGPILSPALALSESAAKIAEALTGPAPDVLTALNEVINIPANVINAFLNGGPRLPVTQLVSVLGSILGVSIPAVTTVGIRMGGLLSPGGSLFNTADLDVVIDLRAPEPPVELHLKGVPAGPIGSLIGMPGSIARALGWDGFGNPLKPGIPVPGNPAVTPGAASRAAAAVVSRPGTRPSPAATAAQTPRRPATGNRAAHR